MINMTVDEVIRLKGNYDRLVEQNRSLQKELREESLYINWNYACNAEYEGFILKRHCWFNSINTPITVGLIDIEYIKDKRRCIYVGIGTGIDFDTDILNIANYGTKIKEWEQEDER